MEGKVIGGCRIIGKIGEGGMGVVYKAEQLSLGRDVALKLLSSQFACAKDYEERFIREAKSAARINHPNVVQVYNAGKEEENLYLLMEYVDGITLREKIKNSPDISSREIAETIRSICLALYEAEKGKIVHRDMKPSNVMITSDGVVKVMDFGLAKCTESPSTLTGTGKILGTPYYMSPEQINGEQVDSRGDIYSTGIILYFMLTKEIPFQGDLSMVINQHLSDQRPDPRKVNPQADEFLVRLYYKMTKRNPQDRFQSFKDIVKKTDEFLSAGAGKKPAQEEKAASGHHTMMYEKKAVKKTSPAAPSRRPLVIGAGVFLAVVVSAAVAWKIMKSPPAEIKSGEKTGTKDSAAAVAEDKSAGQNKIAMSAPAVKIKLTGAALVKESPAEGKIYYKETCPSCGYAGQQEKETQIPASFHKRLIRFRCPQCEKDSLIIVENLK